MQPRISHMPLELAAVAIGPKPLGALDGAHALAARECREPLALLVIAPHVLRRDDERGPRLGVLGDPSHRGQLVRADGLELR